jgi:predicted nucleic-acid-binding protein
LTATDTNVLVRLVTRDDPEQAERAAALFRSGEIFVAKTVLLETEWVLRYSYGLDRQALHRTLRTLLGYPALVIEDRAAVLRALGWYGDGMDFADALHLASSAGADRFATFDRALVRRTESLATRPPAVAL